MVTLKNLTKKFRTLLQLDALIDTFEDAAGIRLIIRKSTDTSRQYRCGSHIGCPFRAKFGLKRFTEDIILKTTYTKAVHPKKAKPFTPKGRLPKKRLKGRMEGIVDEVAAIKDEKPVAKDVMKAAAKRNGMDVTYNQAYRAVANVSARRWEEDKVSYQMIVPYLKKFVELNPGSTVDYSKDNQQRITRLYLCPGIMKSTMMHVRPVMSLDAAHLKSEWKGILYVASVKTAGDKLYPVAIGITQENENESGWSWFLELVRSSIECLVMDYPHGRSRFKYFSFVSDRQKGLMQALAKTFPDNHTWYCSVHIARNVEKWGGKKVSRFVGALSATFSHRISAQILDDIEKISKRARKYLQEIPAERWRGTAWLDDPGLPPRYGITTSNISESTNNMFEKARDKSWLFTVNTIVLTMMERITSLRNRVKGREGVVGHVKATLRNYWDNCAGFRVVEVQMNDNEFIVRHGTTSAAESERVYNINISDRTCMCGEWQDQGYPCIDAMAYFRLHKKMTLNSIVSSYVDKFLTYETEYEMLKTNIYPVCIEIISPDGSTLPPDASKRRSGRPRRRRIRKRPHSACDPEESMITCSKCRRRGHNARTCVARRENELLDNEESNEERGNMDQVERNDDDETGEGSSDEGVHERGVGNPSEVEEVEVTDSDDLVESPEASNEQRGNVDQQVQMNDDDGTGVGSSSEIEDKEVTDSDDLVESEDGSSNKGDGAEVGNSDDIDETDVRVSNEIENA